MLANIDSISGAKRKENLTNHAEDARVSKKLATAIRDIEFDVDLDHLVAEEPDRSRLRDVFREFELRDPLARLEEALGEDGAVPESAPAEQISATAREVAAADLATLDGDHAALAAERRAAPEEAPPGGEQAPLPASGDMSEPMEFAAYAGGDEVLVGEAETLAAIALAWGDRPLVAHDWKAIAMADDPCEAPPLEHDTMVAAYLLDPARRGYPLSELMEQEGLGAAVEGADGLAERAVVTRALAERQRVRLEEMDLERLFHEIELPLVDVLIEMERVGVKLDVEQVRTIDRRVIDEITGLERDIWMLAGEEFTIGSPQQLAEILFNQLGLSKKRRGKTGFSTDARVLAAIRDEHAIIEKVEQWRELSKLKSTYLDAFPELIDDEGRLHTTFNQTATTTGRLSSTNPNLQNIPIRTELGREIRACFVAEEGNEADLGRLLAGGAAPAGAHRRRGRAQGDLPPRRGRAHRHRRGDPRGPRPIPGTRSKAKMVNYGIVYGLSAFGLADRLQIERDEAQEFIDRYLERFPAVKRFIDETIERAATEGQVSTLFGRFRRVPELRSRNPQTRSLGERLAVNMVIQGTAADIMKVAMVRARDALRDAGLDGTRLVLQIHDELLFEAPEDEVEEAVRIVEREMANAFELDPPLGVDVGVGTNWLEAK